MMRTAWWKAVLATVLLLWAQGAAAAPALDVRYTIDVHFDPTDYTLTGSAEVAITNHSGVTLPDIPFVLYPNRYREADPDVDPPALERIYPRAFNPGSIAITAVETTDGTPVDFVVDGSAVPPYTIARATLPRAMAPDGVIELRIHFVTFIPEKFGVFGHFQGVTALKGGWHPYVAPWHDGQWALDVLPDPASYTVSIQAPRVVTIVGANPDDADRDATSRRWRVETSQATSIPLTISPFYQERVEQDTSVQIRYAFLPEDRPYVQYVMATLRQGLAFFRKEYGESALSEIRVAESYLHQELVSSDPRLLFVATRAFKVFAPLKKYHEAELIKGLLFALWRARLPDEEAWVLEGLADASTQRYLRERYQRPPSLLRLLKPVSFIPIVDQILYSNRLPLRQVYFKETTPIIPREDPALFNNRRPDGSSIFFKLAAVIGTDALNAVLDRYTDLAVHGDSRPFRAVVRDETGRDLDWFYRQWLTVNPKTDFSIASIRRERHADGYHTTLDLHKSGEGIEPVTISLLQRDGPPLRTTWLSYDTEYQETFVTPSPITAVELDPDHKTSDPERFNDRRPPAIKVIWEKVIPPGISYDFQTKSMSYDASAYFQRRYDEHNILRMSYSKDETGREGAVTASHDYERSVFSHSTRQSIGIGLTVSHDRTPGAETEAMTALQLSHVLSNAKTSLVYPTELQQLFFGAFPYSTMRTSFIQRISGGKYPSAVRLQFDARYTWSFATLHEVAARATIGRSAGGFTEGRKFELGGSGSLRGYSPGSLSGQSVVLASVEYRRPVVSEFGTNVWGLTLLRRLQAVMFADVGTVHSYETPVSDVGIGVRLTHEILGLYPLVTRIDVAFPINVPQDLKAEEQKPHLYVTAGQPF